MRQLAAPFLALLAVLTTAVCADAARIRLPRPKRGLQMRMGKFTRSIPIRTCTRVILR